MRRIVETLAYSAIATYVVAYPLSWFLSDLSALFFASWPVLPIAFFNLCGGWQRHAPI